MLAGKINLIEGCIFCFLYVLLCIVVAEQLQIS